MREYKVEMRMNGKWCRAHSPNQCLPRTFDDKEKAVEYGEMVKDMWEDLAELKKRHGGYIAEYFPKEFRIVSREVTEWKVE